MEEATVESSSGMEGKHETLTVKYFKNSYEPYITVGYLVEQGRRILIKMLRDTGAKQTMLIAGTIRKQDTGKHLMLRTVEGRVSFPLYRLELHSIYYTGPADVAILPEFPGSDEVDLIRGEDLDDDLIASRILSLVVLNVPVSSPDIERLEVEDPSLFSCCAVARSMVKKGTESCNSNTQGSNHNIQDENTFDLKFLFSTPSISTTDH